jgi:hypothetical protein
MTDDFNETLEQLELLIGKEKAKKVDDFFEGMYIYFPKRIGLYELHSQIYEDLRNGASYYDAAVKYGYTKSYIRKIEHKITDRKRRERQTQGASVTIAGGKPEPLIRPVPRNGGSQDRNNGQGELFYGNGS